MAIVPASETVTSFSKLVPRYEPNFPKISHSQRNTSDKNKESENLQLTYQPQSSSQDYTTALDTAAYSTYLEAVI